MASLAATDGKPMTDNELVSFLGRKIEHAMNDEDGDISDVRIENFNLYVGKPYGNEREGYSSVVTREAMETVEWAMPSVLRVFNSGERAVIFTPEGPEDEAEAEQQTDIANYYLLNRNNGFLTFHHWLKDILMFPNGYAKLYVEEKEKSRVEHYQGLSIQGLQRVLMELAARGETEILEQEVTQRPIVTDQGAGVIEEYEVKIRVTWTSKEPRWIPIPPDEMLIDNDLLSIDMDESDFNCHRVRKTFTQLVNEGYSREQLERVGEGEDYQWLDERTNRLFYQDEDPDQEDEDDPSMRMFWVHECYCYVDFDGDGIAEFRRIVMIGAELMENEETDYQPFVSAAAILLPHKHSGMSYIDIVKDLQEIKSTLWRQMLDNIYKMNVRRKYIGDDFISDDGDTLGILMDTMSEYVPARDPNAIREEAVQPIVSDIMPVIQGMNDLQKVRTGVTPELTLDPNVLQQSTAGAFMTALDRASERVEMLTRILAETGYAYAMKKMHQVLRQHIDRVTAIKLRGEWVEFNPANWHERENTEAKVGLGFNSKEQKLALLQGLLGLQREAMGYNMSDFEKIYDTLAKMVELSGLGHAEQAFIDPSKPVKRTDPQTGQEVMVPWQPPQPQPDPMIELANRDMTIKEQGQQQEFALDQQKLRQDHEEMMLKYTNLELQYAEMVEKIRNMEAERGLTEAQRVKTLTDANVAAEETKMAREALNNA